MGAGEEGIDTMKMGVALIFFTAVLVYVIFNTSFGKNILNSTIDEVENDMYNSQQATFREFTGDGHVVSAAEAYAFIGYNENNIESITCYVHDSGGVTATGMDDTCLKEHLSGNIKMKAVYDQTEGQYKISLLRAE